MNLRILLLWLLLAVTGPALAQSIFVGSLSDLYRLDVTTGQTTLLGRMPTLMNDLALTLDGGLFGVSGNFGNPALSQTFFRIDPVTGAGTVIRRLNYTINGLVAGLDGSLYGAGDAGEIVRIDPATGITTLLGNCRYRCLGDLAFYRGRLYMTAVGNRLIEIDRQVPSRSRLVGTLNIGSDVLGLATVGVESCDEKTLKLCGTAGSTLYEIDPGTAVVRAFSTYDLASIDGAASPIPVVTGLLPSAGRDSTARVCADASAVSLGQYLFGADAGGRWRVVVGSGQLAGDVYQTVAPAIPGPSRLEYIVGTGSCADTSVVRLTYSDCLPRVYLPTAFSPNGDQQNDFFVIYLSDGPAYVEQLTILNRWGQIIHSRAGVELRSGDVLWDGTTNGTMAEAGLYTYQLRVRYDTGEPYRLGGNVMVLR